MKKLVFGIIFGLVTTTQAHATYKVIGETNDCPIKTLVIQNKNTRNDNLKVKSMRKV